MKGPPKSVLLQQTLSQPRVSKFLNSIARNTQKSKEAYGVGLAHFQNFLAQQKASTVESSIDSLQDNTINVYTLLDDFVSFILANSPT